MITQEIVKSLLDYNNVNGNFTWKKNRGGFACIGSAASAIPNSKGYLIIGINGVRYQQHRIAWLYMTGEMPIEQVDHIDGDKTNNSFANLRQANNANNCKNRPCKSTNKIGIKGVSRLPSGRYSSEITSNGVRKYLGSFDTIDLAHFAYCNAASSMHGEFANTNRSQK